MSGGVSEPCAERSSAAAIGVLEACGGAGAFGQLLLSERTSSRLEGDLARPQSSLFAIAMPGRG